MEEDFQGRPTELQLQCFSARIMSPEIVEIGEESKSIISSRDGGATDIYVAVDKGDIDVLKWALNHVVSPGCCVFLVHVFPLLTYIPTPVGRLVRSQLSQEQLRVYINEENNRRRNLLQKYIRLCTDAEAKREKNENSRVSEKEMHQSFGRLPLFMKAKKWMSINRWDCFLQHKIPIAAEALWKESV